MNAYRSIKTAQGVHGNGGLYGDGVDASKSDEVYGNHAANTRVKLQQISYNLSGLT